MTPTVEVLDPLSPEHDRHHIIWRQVEVVRRLSDRVVGVGPFGVGMDGLLTFIPLVGGAYSLGAGGYLLVQAFRARAKGATIGVMAVYLAADLMTSEIPLIGDLIDLALPAHQMAGRALQKDIEARYGAPPEIIARGKRPWWKLWGR